jgi:hypothetical protein
VQLVDYTDDVHNIGRTKSAVSEVYEEPKETAKGIGLNIRVEKKVQNGRTRKRCEILAKIMTLKLLGALNIWGL